MNTWTQEEIEILKHNYKTMSNIQLHNLINNHSIGSIKSKLSKMGLKRDMYTINKDGISFPNKFMYALLGQMNLNFETEKIFKWSENRIYDFYIRLENNMEIIIEMHGSQHFINHGFHDMGGRTLEEEKVNDKRKKELALLNDINYYFEIDCSKSDIQYIKISLIQSGLLDILEKNHVDTFKINYEKCSRFACNNIAKEIYEIKRAVPDLPNYFLAKEFNICEWTVKRYLKKMGFKNNHNYSPFDEVRYKPVYCLEIDKYFFNPKDAAKILINFDFKKNGILHFKYVQDEEYSKVRKYHPQKCPTPILTYYHCYYYDNSKCS